jgi:hypothetical protein
MVIKRMDDDAAGPDLWGDRELLAKDSSLPDVLKSAI